MTLMGWQACPVHQNTSILKELYQPSTHNPTPWKRPLKQLYKWMESQNVVLIYTKQSITVIQF